MKKAKYKILLWFRKNGMLCKKPVYKKPVIKISRTVYPNGTPTISPNTGTEWYGIIDEKKIN